MSFFSWFMRKPPAKRQLPQPSVPSNAVGPASQPGRNQRSSSSVAAPEQAAATKNERMERRELLYIVVRDAMVCAGVLSASYKFKVLSLDPRGLQFLVMMDLAPEFGGETERLSEIETLIAQTAKARYGITVSAVYWRVNELVAVAAAPKSAALPSSQSHQQLSARPELARPGAGAAPLVRPASASAPAPLERPKPPVAAPAAAPVATGAAPVRLVVPRFDPIEADEVAAFKQALATAAAARAPAAAAPGVPQRTGARRPPATNDFADTVMPDQDSRAQSLSSTQYGEL